MKKIFIAIPNQGAISARLVANLLYWTHDKRYQTRVFAPENLYPLDVARNRCVKEFLRTNYDYLWWIDDDIVPPKNALDRLLMADKDIIGALCFSMRYEKGEAFPYPVALKRDASGGYAVHYGEDIEEVDAVGGACVMVKRRVYEAVKNPYEFHYRDGELSLTCDFDVWQKAQKAGFKVYVDYNLMCSHIKEVDIMQLQNCLARVKNG